ncbi:MAG: hypothetical protein AAGC97_03530 [Planctomycetota bacterium]
MRLGCCCWLEGCHVEWLLNETIVDGGDPAITRTAERDNVIDIRVSRSQYNAASPAQKAEMKYHGYDFITRVAPVDHLAPKLDDLTQIESDLATIDGLINPAPDGFWIGYLSTAVSNQSTNWNATNDPTGSLKTRWDAIGPAIDAAQTTADNIRPDLDTLVTQLPSLRTAINDAIADMVTNREFVQPSALDDLTDAIADLASAMAAALQARNDFTVHTYPITAIPSYDDAGVTAAEAGRDGVIATVNAMDAQLSNAIVALSDALAAVATLGTTEIDWTGLRIEDDYSVIECIQKVNGYYGEPHTYRWQSWIKHNGKRRVRDWSVASVEIHTIRISSDFATPTTLTEFACGSGFAGSVIERPSTTTANKLATLSPGSFACHASDDLPLVITQGQITITPPTQAAQWTLSCERTRCPIDPGHACPETIRRRKSDVVTRTIEGLPASLTSTTTRSGSWTGGSCNITNTTEVTGYDAFNGTYLDAIPTTTISDVEYQLDDAPMDEPFWFAACMAASHFREPLTADITETTSCSGTSVNNGVSTDPCNGNAGTTNGPNPLTIDFGLPNLSNRGDPCNVTTNTVVYIPLLADSTEWLVFNFTPDDPVVIMLCCDVDNGTIKEPLENYREHIVCAGTTLTEDTNACSGAPAGAVTRSVTGSGYDIAVEVAIDWIADTIPAFLQP